MNTNHTQRQAQNYKELIQKKFGINLSQEEAENELARFLDLLDLVINDSSNEINPHYKNSGVKN